MTVSVSDFSRGSLRGRYLDAEPIQALLSEEQSVEDWFANYSREMKATPKLSARLLGDDEHCWFAKAYYPSGFLRKIALLLGRNHADKVFDDSLRLLEAGVSVPSPLAVFGEGGGFSARAHYYVCQALTQAQDLRQILDQGLFDELNRRHGLLPKIAESLAQLHEAGYAHGDMKWANIMLDPNNGQLWFIDLDGLRQPRFFRERHFARDLARFLVNARAFGVDEGMVQDFVNRYAEQRQQAVSKVWKAIEPSYHKLAERHRRQYGARL